MEYGISPWISYVLTTLSITFSIQPAQYTVYAINVQYHRILEKITPVHL